MDRFDPDYKPPPETGETWCLGLPYVSRREPTAEERAQIERLARQLRLAGLLVALPLPFVFVALVRIAATWSASQLGSAIAFGLLLGALPVVVAMCRDRLRRSRLLLKDLEIAAIDRYEGPPPRPTWSEPALINLVRLGLVRQDADVPQWIEALPASGLVWRANGVRPRRWIAVTPVNVAPTPEFSRIAAEWVQPLPTSDQVQLYYNQRPMSPAEMEELGRYRLRLIVRPLPIALAVNAYIAILSVPFSAEGHLPAGYHRFMFMWLVVVTILTDIEMAKRLRLSGAMRRDTQVGQITIFRSREEPKEGAEENAEAGLSSSMEYLPVSRLPWTTAGAPASWRITPVR